MIEGADHRQGHPEEAEISHGQQGRAGPPARGRSHRGPGDFLERAEELVRARVDVLAIDSATATRRGCWMRSASQEEVPKVGLLAGNVATYEGPWP